MSQEEFNRLVDRRINEALSKLKVELKSTSNGLEVKLSLDNKEICKSFQSSTTIGWDMLHFYNAHFRHH